jgi:hypothetical protein
MALARLLTHADAGVPAPLLRPPVLPDLAGGFRRAMSAPVALSLLTEGR